MSNSWYGRVKGFLAGTKARGSDVRFEYDALEDAFDNMPAPHSSAPTTKGFSGAVDFEGAVSLSGGLGANADGADTYKLTSMIDGSDSQDYATLANVTAEVAGGGTPSNIPITSLGVGTATASQLITINSGGTAVVGRDPGFTNFLINGDMRVSQQGASYTSATNPANDDDTYLVDGWYLLSDGDDIFDVTQHTTAADLPDGAYAATRLDVETISKKGGVLQILEAREVARLFEGGNGTASLSFKAKRTGSDMEIKAAVLAWDSTADAVTSDIVSAWGADGATPTWAANWTAENTPANLSLSTSYQTFRIEGISLDTASTTNLAVFIWVDTTTSNAGEFVYITDVQLEPGAITTPYYHEPLSSSILRCRRFLLNYQADASNEYFIMIQAASTSAADGAVTFPVTMFSDPTFSVSAVADWKTLENNTNQTCTAVSQIAQTPEDSLIRFTTGATMVAGAAGYATAKVNDAWMRWVAIL